VERSASRRDRGAGIPVAVVGLASGITAGEALRAGASHVTVLEIEPAVVRAAQWFVPENGDVLADPRTELVVDDARAVARADPPHVPAIVSEPSNPWLAGVSSLFTREYWALAQRHLEPGGVFVQWLQLYSLPSDAFRGLVRTFLSVFPEAWLFETIPGSDALLVAASSLPPDLGIEPVLGPEGSPCSQDGPVSTPTTIPGSSSWPRTGSTDRRAPPINS
jgi:hypothetical protein